MTDTLVGKYGNWALVTGASSGIGEQFARLLAAQGFRLIISARRDELLQTLATELTQQHGVEIRTVACDLADGAQLDELIKAGMAVPLGLIVSNAGFGAKGEFLQHDARQLEAMIQTNCLAGMKLVHALLPIMVARRRGALIFTGSIEGYLPFPWSAPYAASKAFIHSLGGALWAELRPQGIDVLVLSPGSTDTDAPIKQGVPREKLMGLMSPQTVAAQTLRQLGRRAYFTPGLHNRLFMGFLGLLPRTWAIQLAGAGMRSALKK